MGGDVCGWEFVKPSCFNDGTCTKKITCTYDLDSTGNSGYMEIKYEVTRTAGEYKTFDLRAYKIEFAKFKVPKTASKFRFWQCTRTPTSRRRRDTGAVHTEVSIWEKQKINETIYDPVLKDVVEKEIYTINNYVEIARQNDAPIRETTHMLLLTMLGIIFMITIALAAFIFVRMKNRGEDKIMKHAAPLESATPPKYSDTA